MTPRSIAAVLIDFENVFYFLKSAINSPDGTTAAVTSVIQALKQHLATHFGEQVISLDAYADFDRIEESSQSELYLLGVETHNVLGTDHKNAADMRLAIDCVDILYSRPEISTIVLVAGDRDYIPVIQHLKKRGRTVRVAGFPKSTSGDLLTIVGTEYFIDVTPFVPVPRARPAVTISAVLAHPAGGRLPSPASSGTVDWDRYETQAIEIMFRHFSGKKEVWLMPYLHKLRAEIPELTEPERRSIVSRLSEKNVVKVEKREGEPNDYSVILPNLNHPLIRASHQGQ